MTTNVSKAVLKKMSVQEFETAYNEATANMDEYERILFLEKMTASIKELVKDQVKVELMRRKS